MEIAKLLGKTFLSESNIFHINKHQDR